MHMLVDDDPGLTCSRVVCDSRPFATAGAKQPSSPFATCMIGPVAVCMPSSISASSSGSQSLQKQAFQPCLHETGVACLHAEAKFPC